MTPPRPCLPAEAVARALAQVGKGVYGLGAGGYSSAHPFDPFTVVKGLELCDCWAFAGSYCYRLPLHRAGYNHGAWSTVSDDVNCDSAIEDSEHAKELWIEVDRPELGDLLVFPSIRGPDGKRIRIGHVGIVTAAPAEWSPADPQFGLVQVVQCSPSAPAIKRGPGVAWHARESFRSALDYKWRTRILRSVP